MGRELEVVIKSSTRLAFDDAWESFRVILFSAPCGCGKTVTARALLKGRKTFYVSASETDFTTLETPENLEALVVDDLHELEDEESILALRQRIRDNVGTRFVLLGRGRVPGWLMPFQVSGLLYVFEPEDFLLDREATKRLLESRGVTVSPVKFEEIMKKFKGFPLGLELLCPRLARESGFNEAMFDACRLDIFIYFDTEVYHRFDDAMRTLMLSLAAFESFDLELARMVSGEPRAGELLTAMQVNSRMLVPEGQGKWSFWPIFRNFLIWETRREMTVEEEQAIFRRAGLYYELKEDIAAALDCYSKANDQKNISALLIRNAELHPGVGQYRETRDYYYALPEAEIRRSSALMCGMSMLTALSFDYEASEEWYRELVSYAESLKKSDAEYKIAQGRIAYLDIALPQRGSDGLIEIISRVFKVMTCRQVRIPSFSVTSTLPSVMNGGKDFSEWSRKDDLLYMTMRGPVEAILGKDGVGLADCAICESKFEKGEDVSKRALNLAARMGEIEAKGTPDIGFAVTGLLARIQVSRGKAKEAYRSIEILRERYIERGETRFLGNIDALLCRISLCLDDEEKALEWLNEKAPANEARLWVMWRYQYLTRAMVEYSIGRYEDAMLLLSRLSPYSERCKRTLDMIQIHLLTALCLEQRGDPEWKKRFQSALEISAKYNFIHPIAAYGAAVLPLLREAPRMGNEAFIEEVTAAAREQAVQYPRFLRRRDRAIEPLSAAETQVLRLVSENLSNQEIGEILGIKLATVKTHVSHILRKLGVSRRSEAKEAAEKYHLL